MLYCHHMDQDLIHLIEENNQLLKENIELTQKNSKKINNNLFISDLVEKPSLKNSPSNYAIIGRYVLPKKIISSLQNTKSGSSGEVQITDAIKRLIYNDNKFVGHIFSGTYLDCGTINGYNNSLKKF